MEITYMEVVNGNKSKSMKKIEKRCIPNEMNLVMMVSSMLKLWGFIKPLSGLYNGEKNVAGTEMDLF